MTEMNPKVEALLSKTNWHEERKKLRAILLDCQLSEEVKWGQLCYTFQNSNVAIIFGMKETCGISFFKGSLLKDSNGILGKPGENSQAARLISFTNVQQIAEMEPIVKAYVYEAIEVEKAGLKVDFKAKRELVFPEELTNALDDNPDLATAFHALTPGRQRAYVLHFSGAKQSATRTARVEKCVDRILAGKGMMDR